MLYYVHRCSCCRESHHSQSMLSAWLSVCCALVNIGDICVMCSLSWSVVGSVLAGELYSNIKLCVMLFGSYWNGWVESTDKLVVHNLR